MLRIWLILLPMVLTIASSALVAGDQTPRDLLVGRWSMVRGLPCKRAEYVYYPNGRFSILFNQNNLAGTYEIIPAGYRQKVVWHFTKDDKRPNCSGKDWGLVGRSLSLYFDVNRGTPDRLNYYAEEKTNVPHSVFSRVGNFQP